MNMSTCKLSMKFCTVLLILTQIFSGCSTSQIVQESNQTAQQTVFDRPKAADLWNPDSAPDLKIPEVTSYVQSIVQRLEKHALHAPYQIRVSDDVTVNGVNSLGEITLTRGMLNACQNEAEIAAYIGHEIGHEDLHHPSDHREGAVAGLMHRAINQAVTYIPDTTGAVGAAQQHAEDIRQARFSQQDEQAADEYGAQLAAKAGYNPYDFAALFDRLSGMVDKNPLYRLAKLKGSHKALDVRANHLRSYLEKKKYPHKGREGSITYRRSLVSLLSYGGGPGPATKAPPEVYAELGNLKTEIGSYRNSTKHIAVLRKVQILRKLHELNLGYGAIKLRPIVIPRHSRLYSDSRFCFMEELISLGSPLWSTTNDSGVSNIVHDEIQDLAHLIVAGEQLGTPYVSGGKTGDGLDCSGLVQSVFGDYFGDLGPNGEGALSAAEQYRMLLNDGHAPIALGDLQQGDIIYFSHPGGTDATHTGIVEGIVTGADGSDRLQIIAASPGAGEVVEQTLNSDGSLDGGTVFLGGGWPGED